VKGVLLQDHFNTATPALMNPPKITGVLLGQGGRYAGSSVRECSLGYAESSSIPRALKEKTYCFFNMLSVRFAMLYKGTPLEKFVKAESSR
jgi:hypothetical protein